MKHNAFRLRWSNSIALMVICAVIEEIVALISCTSFSHPVILFIFLILLLLFSMTIIIIISSSSSSSSSIAAWWQRKHTALDKVDCKTQQQLLQCCAIYHVAKQGARGTTTASIASGRRTDNWHVRTDRRSYLDVRYVLSWNRHDSSRVQSAAMSFCSISGRGGSSNIDAINQTGNEARNVGERPGDVTACWAGCWWSTSPR